MKKLIALVTLLTFNAHAAMTVGLITFGSIGPSMETLPKASSTKDAAEIFQSIQTTQAGNAKIIDARDGSLKCLDLSTGRKKAFSCAVFADMTKTKLVAAATGGPATQVSFSGDLARQIYASMLTITATARVGATTKQAGNLRCVKGVNPTRSVICTFSGVRFSQMTE